MPKIKILEKLLVMASKTKEKTNKTEEKEDMKNKQKHDIFAKYKKGDKFVVEIAERHTHYTDDGKPYNVYRIKGFNTLMLDDYAIARLTPCKKCQECTQEKQDNISSPGIDKSNYLNDEKFKEYIKDINSDDMENNDFNTCPTTELPDVSDVCFSSKMFEGDEDE